MAVVPPSSQRQAARAAAEIVARKKNNEAEHRRMAERLRGSQGSVASSVLAEQQILAMDSDSDIENEHMHGWAMQAMQKSDVSAGVAGRQAGPLRERSWSDTDSSSDENEQGIESSEDDDDDDGGSNGRRINGWRSSTKRRRHWPNPRRARMLRNNSISNQASSSPNNESPLRTNASSGFKDQTLDRALSMIGVSHVDSQDSNSTSGGNCSSSSSENSPNAFQNSTALSPSMASINSMHVHFQGIDNYSISEPGCYDASQSFPCIPSSSHPTNNAEAASAIYERKRRVDKLREFFGGADPSSMLASKQSSSMDTRAGGDTVRSMSTINSFAASTVSSYGSMDFEFAEGNTAASALTAEQRNLLVRRRRKLRALLGEDCIGHQLMPHGALPASGNAGKIKTKGALINGSALGLAGVALSLLPTPNDTSAAESSLSSTTSSSSSGPHINNAHSAALSVSGEADEQFCNTERCASGELEKLRDAQIRQFTKIREVLGDSAPAPFLYDLRGKDADTPADPALPMPAYLRYQTVAPASVSDEQRMRARWRRNKLMAVLGDMPNNVTTLYKSDPHSNVGLSDQASDSEAMSDASGVVVQHEDTIECDKDELAFARMKFGTGAMPVGMDPKGKQGRRRRVKKLKSFFGQSLSSEAMLTQQQQQRQGRVPAVQNVSNTSSRLALLDTVAEEPENMSTASFLATTDSNSSEQSYEFIPIRSTQPQEHVQKSPDWRLSLTQSQQASSTLSQNLGLAGIDCVERPFKAQFWVTASPDSQASIVTTNEKTSRRTSLMASLKARKASIIGSIKRATPSTTSVNTQGLAQSKHNNSSVVSLAHGLLRPRSSSNTSMQSSNAQHNKACAAVGNSPGTKYSEVSSPASSKLGFIARQINKVASASPKLGNATNADTGSCGISCKTAANAHSQSSPLALPCRSSSIKPLSPLPAISPNNFHASFDRGLALREMVAVAEFISNGRSPSSEFPPRIRSAAVATAKSIQMHNGPASPRNIHQQIISSALLSANGQIASQISTRSSRNAFDESSSQQGFPGRQIGSKSVHWFDSPKPVAQQERQVPERQCAPIARDAIAVNSIAFPQTSSAKSSMDSVTMSIVLRSP
ncbi:hypothetical protein LPJ64_006300, partial [Coemansia asiatica]